MKNKDLKRRIVEISYKKKLSHISSCLTAVDIIEEIYRDKRKDEPFILSSGHAGLALYVVLEKYEGKDAERIFDHHGVHPDRCDNCGISCSTGSLGMGLPIALGMALADTNRNVFCLVSDGECTEGSIYESIRIMAENMTLNLSVSVNINGYSAYKEISREIAEVPRTRSIYTDMDDYPEYLQGLEGHYHVLNEKEYLEVMKILE